MCAECTVYIVYIHFIHLVCIFTYHHVFEDKFFGVMSFEVAIIAEAASVEVVSQSNAFS